MEIRSIGRNLVVLAAAAALVGGCGSKDGGGAGKPTTPASAGSAAAGGSGGPAAADNGVATLEASAILDRAKAALTAAKSFRVAGTVNDNTQKTTVDVKIRDGDLAGTMAVGPAQVQLLKVGGKQYMKPNAEFWKTVGDQQSDDVTKKVGDRWVLVPANDTDFGSLFEVADVNQLLNASGRVSKGPAKQIDGKPAVGLVDQEADGRTLYVATTGEPYPLRLDDPTVADGGLTFSDFKATFADIQPPAAADVLDLAKLRH